MRKGDKVIVGNLESNYYGQTGKIIKVLRGVEILKYVVEVKRRKHEFAKSDIFKLGKTGTHRNIAPLQRCSIRVSTTSEGCPVLPVV
jgi:hypothetical protein